MESKPRVKENEFAIRVFLAGTAFLLATTLIDASLNLLVFSTTIQTEPKIYTIAISVILTSILIERIAYPITRRGIELLMEDILYPGKLLGSNSIVSNLILSTLFLIISVFIYIIARSQLAIVGFGELQSVTYILSVDSVIEELMVMSAGMSVLGASWYFGRAFNDLLAHLKERYQEHGSLS